MKNITEMRDQLSTLFAQLKDGSVDVKVASEMNNTAGKIIGSLKVELDYAAQRNEVPSIQFLNNGGGSRSA